jgi:hypothetical protein
MKCKWERLTDTQDRGSCTYLWYKNMQESAIGYGVPVMLFHGSVLQHEAHGLCMPGMGKKIYETCGKLFLKILRRYVPDDTTEEAENIQEMMACHTNGFETLWYIMKVVVKMMDPYRAPTRSLYKGSLWRHAGAWDVYRMMIHHRGKVFKAEDCSIGLLRGITDPRFSPAAKVELEILTSAISNGVKSGTAWGGTTCEGWQHASWRTPHAC